MYKTAVIGDRDSVMGFMAAGFSVFEVSGAAEAAHKLKELADGEYAVIFVVEDIARQIEADIEKYKTGAVPAVILIPGRNGSDGYSMAAIKSAVERAVGADILFK